MIRPAARGDLEVLVALVRELADHQGAIEEVALRPDDLDRALFGPVPRAFAHVAEEAGEVVAMAIWFRTFSTWTGRHGIWLEDLYVRPAWRRRKLATALVATLAELALAEGAARLEWSVLDDNTSARGLYAALGARRMEGATVNRLSGEALGRAAGGLVPAEGAAAPGEGPG